MSESEMLTFGCPRCGSSVDEAYYGPCTSCRGLLKAQYAGRERDDLVAEEYVPKMNVTPNAVALKD